MLKPYSYPFKGMIQKRSEDTTQILSLRRPDLRTVMGILTVHYTLCTHMHRMMTYTKPPGVDFKD